MVLYKRLSIVLMGCLLGICCNPPMTVAGMNVDHHGLTVDSDDPQACLECHDGTIGPNVDTRVKGCSDGILSSHPVNMVYPPAGKEKSFNSASFIEQEGLELANGKVTCLSCHNLKKDFARHLAVSNIRSQLCLICHRR